MRDWKIHDRDLQCPPRVGTVDLIVRQISCDRDDRRLLRHAQIFSCCDRRDCGAVRYHGLIKEIDVGPVDPLVHQLQVGCRDRRPGESSRVYPRASGGAAMTEAEKLQAKGLSPRGRGSRKLPHRVVRSHGSIPARAGEPGAAFDQLCAIPCARERHIMAQANWCRHRRHIAETAVAPPVPCGNANPARRRVDIVTSVTLNQLLWGVPWPPPLVSCPIASRIPGARARTGR